MKFALTTELGNDAMQTGDDLSKALSRLSEVVRGLYMKDGVIPHVIRDENGNTVGMWEIA